MIINCIKKNYINNNCLLNIIIISNLKLYNCVQINDYYEKEIIS